MLEGIGRIGSYLNLKQLKMAKDYKVKTGQTLKFDKTSDIQTITAQKTSSGKSGDAIKAASIRNKLKHGEKLSTQEMNYLKENDENLYRKAKKVEQAREELEADLRRCKTKAEARQAVMRASLKAAGEASAELAAAKAGMGGGGVPAGGGYQAGQEVGGPSIDAGVGDMGSVGAEAGAVAGGEAGYVDANVSAGEQVTVEGQQIASDNIAAANESANSGEAGAAEASSEAGQADKNDGSDKSEGIAGSNGKDNEEDKVMAILEELMYKMKAIQKTWEEFAKSKEYRDMPENVASEAGKVDRGYTKRESQALDMVLTYKTQQMEADAERLIDMHS